MNEARAQHHKSSAGFVWTGTCICHLEAQEALQTRTSRQGLAEVLSVPALGSQRLWALSLVRASTKLNPRDGPRITAQ